MFLNLREPDQVFVILEQCSCHFRFWANRSATASVWSLSSRELPVHPVARRHSIAMKSHILTPPPHSVAATVAPEDLRCGDAVALLNIMTERTSLLPCDDLPGGGVREPTRVRWMAVDAGQPYRVQAVCLPFVFLSKCSSGQYRTVDVRRVQLVRLDHRYAKFVTKSLRRFRRRCRLK
jgi:hypothetical protein